ncbi:MAG: rhodanese-like domain-containing protein [Deltaproteobacteria bacterium]
MAIPRITKEELKAKMDKNEDLVIVDARAEDSYNLSNQKIKGSIRITLDELEKGIKNPPVGKEIITYCT